MSYRHRAEAAPLSATEGGTFPYGRDPGMSSDTRIKLGRRGGGSGKNGNAALVTYSPNLSPWWPNAAAVGPSRPSTAVSRVWTDPSGAMRSNVLNGSVPQYRLPRTSNATSSQNTPLAWILEAPALPSGATSMATIVLWDGLETYSSPSNSFSPFGPGNPTPSTASSSPLAQTSAVPPSSDTRQITPSAESAAYTSPR